VGTIGDLDPALPGIDEGRFYGIAKIHDIGSSGVPSSMRAALNGHGSTTNLRGGGTRPIPWAFQSGAEREYRPTRAKLRLRERGSLKRLGAHLALGSGGIWSPPLKPCKVQS